MNKQQILKAKYFSRAKQIVGDAFNVIIVKKAKSPGAAKLWIAELWDEDKLTARFPQTSSADRLLDQIAEYMGVRR